MDTQVCPPPGFGVLLRYFVIFGSQLPHPHYELNYLHDLLTLANMLSQPGRKRDSNRLGPDIKPSTQGPGVRISQSAP